MAIFSDNSAKRLSQCHPDLQALFNEAIATSPVDFGVSCGYRGEEDQEAAFAKGNSKAHFGQSPHNFRPALALDIACLDGGKITWEPEFYEAVAAHVMSVAETLGVGVTWGGDFKSFKDRPHFELRDWKALRS